MIFLPHQNTLHDWKNLYIVVAISGAIVVYSWTGVRVIVRRQPLITLHHVRVIGTKTTIIIATSVVIGAVNVDARGVAV